MNNRLKSGFGFRNILRTVVLAVFATVLFTGCLGTSGTESAGEDDSGLVVIGFSQVGSESSWRVANSESMKAAFSEENGFELIFDDAKQKQENQYKAIRTFIQQDVDYIVLAPITENGWDDVLLEAKEAGIPVIIVDRQVNVSDDSLYTSWVGSNFLQEGQTAVAWLEQELATRILEAETEGDDGAEDAASVEQKADTLAGEDTSEDTSVGILHLKGTLGATSQIMRTRGLEEALAAHPDWKLIRTLEGDYTEAKSYELTKAFLEDEELADSVDVVYCENDNMAYGVMRALDEAGIAYGGKTGVIIISFDAVRSALEQCLAGKINLVVECNPLHGPRVVSIIDLLRQGFTPSKMLYVEETSFSYRDITREMIDSRKY